MRDVLAVEEDLAARRRDKAHDDLGKRGLAAAVGAGKDDELAVGNVDGNVLQDRLLSFGRRDGIGDVLQFQHEKKTSLQKLPLEYS